MKILITNDDGPKTPLLSFLIKAILRLPEVETLRVVVPLTEQSWKGTSMSYGRRLTAAETRIAGVDAVLLDGTPADCVNWGVHFLFGDKAPDLVVSGINSGRNAGLGFVLSSGTIGACFHANIMQPPMPAIAVSQDFEDLSHAGAIKRGAVPANQLGELRKNTERHVRLLWDSLQAEPEFPGAVATWNANFPEHPADHVRVEEARIGKGLLGRCFCRDGEGEGFVHSLAEYAEDDSMDADTAIIRRGNISLTRIDLKNLTVSQNRG